MPAIDMVHLKRYGFFAPGAGVFAAAPRVRAFCTIPGANLFPDCIRYLSAAISLNQRWKLRAVPSRPNRNLVAGGQQHPGYAGPRGKICPAATAQKM